MPKRGNKHIHISIRVKRAFKKYRKTGVFSLTALTTEIWPVAVSPVNFNDTSDLVTMNVTFDYLSKTIMFGNLGQKNPSFSYHYEKLSKEESNKQTRINKLNEQWLELIRD